MEQRIIDILKQTYDKSSKESLNDKGDGWVNMGVFLRTFNKSGINYKRLGFEYFGDMIAESGLFYVWTDYSGEKPTKYIIEKRNSPENSSERTPGKRNMVSRTVDNEEENKIKRRLRLENSQFIGQFVPQQTEGWYKITDIRNTDFTKIEDKERGIKDLSISFRSPNREFNKFAYYRFTWVLLDSSPIKFGIDLREEVVPVWPKDIVNSLYEGIIIHFTFSRIQSYIKNLKTLRNVS